MVLHKGISRGLDSVAQEGVAVSVGEDWGDDGAGAGVGGIGDAKIARRGGRRRTKGEERERRQKNERYHRTGAACR